MTCYLDLAKDTEFQAGRLIQVVKMYLGGEYLNGEMQKHFRSHWIDRKLKTAYSPPWAAVAEQINYTLFD